MFAGFISPYGIIPSTFTPPFPLMNYALFWDLLTTAPMLKSAIAELRGTFAMPGFRPWLFLAYVVMLGRTFRWRHLVSDTGNTLACILSAVLAVSTRRFLPLFGIMALPYVVARAETLGPGCHARAQRHTAANVMRLAPGIGSLVFEDDQFDVFLPVTRATDAEPRGEQPPTTP